MAAAAVAGSLPVRPPAKAQASTGEQKEHCLAVAGCRRPTTQELPRCWMAVPLVPSNRSSSLLQQQDRKVSDYLQLAPRFGLPLGCSEVLRDFACLFVVGGCGAGQGLTVCNSTCGMVNSICGRAVVSQLPLLVQQVFNCSRYPSESWPHCSVAVGPTHCTEYGEAPSRCSLSETPVLDVAGACILCRRGAGEQAEMEEVPLVRDSCGVCRGDGSKCSGCDGSGGRWDACGDCRGPATSCRRLHEDPKLLGRLALAGLLVLVVASLGRCLVLLRRALWCGDTAGGDGDPGEASGCGGSSRGWLQRLLDGAQGLAVTVHVAESRFFCRLGMLVARHVRGVVWISMFAAACLGCGLMRIKMHGDPLAFWVPTNAPSVANAERLKLITRESRYRILMVLLSMPGDLPVDFRSGLLEAAALHEAISQLRAGLEEKPWQVVGMHEACTSVFVSDLSNTTRCPSADASSCHWLCTAGGLSPDEPSWGVLSPWHHDRATLAVDRDPVATLRTAMWDHRGADGGLGAAALRDVVGLRDEGLAALHLTFPLDGTPQRRAEADAWERAVMLLLRDSAVAKRLWPSWKVHAFCERQLSDEILAAIQGDVLILPFGFVAMLLYTGVCIGRSAGCGRCRWSSALAAVVTVALAMLSAFGLCALCGVDYNPTVNIALFMLLGVGVDAAFVAAAALEDEVLAAAPVGVAAASAAAAGAAAAGEAPGVGAEVERDIGAALGGCGTSILLSSATSALAFALGAFTPLPALRAFCIYASAGMVFGLVFQLTFFVAVLTWDERRRRCTPSGASRDGVEKLPPGGGDQHNGGLALWLTGVVFKRWFPLVVLVLHGVLLVESVRLAYSIKVHLHVNELVPSDSATSHFLARLAQVLPHQQTPVEVFVQHAAFLPGLAAAPISDATVRHNLYRLRGALLATDVVADVGGAAPLWLDAFSEHLRLHNFQPMDALGAELFFERLAEFFKTPDGTAAERYGLVVRRGGSVVATRLFLLAEGYGTDVMVALRGTIAGSGLAHAAFSYSFADIYCEQDAVLRGYTAANLVLMIVVVVASIFLLSGDLGFAVAMLLCVLSCCLLMLAWMAALSIKLNAISLIPLLLSVGLCVDYNMHVGHAFWVAEGSPAERMALALRSRGAAVVNGGVSTILSQVLLLTGESVVFTTFFKMMAGMFVVGLFHALLVLPAALVALGSSSGSSRPHRPPPIALAKDVEEQDELLRLPRSVEASPCGTSPQALAAVAGSQPSAATGSTLSAQVVGRGVG